MVAHYRRVPNMMDAASSSQMFLPLCQIHSNIPKTTVIIIYMFISQANKLILITEIGLDILPLVITLFSYIHYSVLTQRLNTSEAL